MADATDLKSVGLSAREGSSPSPGTTLKPHLFGVFFCLRGEEMRGAKKPSELERAVQAGIHGTPQLRPDEKRRYLGFFRERVIQAVTFRQLQTAEGFQVIKEALSDSRGVELVIHKKARTRAMPLIAQARKQGLDFTIVSNPNLRGEVGVILVARDAVDVPVLYSEQES